MSDDDRRIQAPGEQVLRFRTVTVRREGGEVLLLNGLGQLLLRVPWRAAFDVGAAIIQQARRVQEVADRQARETVVRDQAILNRRGIPIGLAVDLRLQDEAMREAHWNSDLRRYLPGGVRSEEAVGTPTLIQHPPKEDASDGS